MFINYVTNFNYSVTEMTCANGQIVRMFTGSNGLAAFATAYKKAVAPNRTTSVVRISSSNVGVGFLRKVPFYILVSGFAGYERMIVTGTQDDTNGDLLLQVLRGPDAGDHRRKFDISIIDTLPATPTAEWSCHPKLYNDGRTCDCRCGMADPDCLFPNLVVVNCGHGEMCSKAGRCTTPEAAVGLDMTTVFVSEPCSHLLMPGNTELVGFMGSRKAYETSGGSKCYTCPAEPGMLYGGAAMRSEVCDAYGCAQDYVCRYKAKGIVDARNVLAFDESLET